MMDKINEFIILFENKPIWLIIAIIDIILCIKFYIIDEINKNKKD